MADAGTGEKLKVFISYSRKDSAAFTPCGGRGNTGLAESAMKLDKDFVREILMAIEADPKFDGSEARTLEPFDGHSQEETNYHSSRLVQAGLIDGNVSKPHLPTIIRGLTFEGHEYIDSIRDPTIWQRTKEGLQDAQGFSLDLVKALAKGFLKKQIEERTGVKLDI